MSDGPTVIVTKLRREDDIWRAHVSDGQGNTIEVDRRFGSWHALVPRVKGSTKRVRRDVLPHVAHALQAKVRPIEKAERRAKEEGKQ